MNVTDAQWHALKGTVYALKAAVGALVEAHALDCLISHSLEVAKIAAEGQSLPKPVPEEFLAAMQRTLEELVRVATEAEAASPNPRRSGEED